MSVGDNCNDGFTDNSQRGTRMFQSEVPKLAWLTILAEEYSRLSGEAFANLRDADARRFREAAKSLLELRDKLPPLGEPPDYVTRATAGLNHVNR